MPGLSNVTVFVSPLASAPVLQLFCCKALASCGRSPTLVKVKVVPLLIRVRAGEKLYSVLLAPILIASTPAAIAPVGPATVGGAGGGYNGPSWPFNEKVQTASPEALPCIELPPVAIVMYSSPSTS